MPRMMKAEREKIRREHQERLAEARRIVATGKCPMCGEVLRRNSSMAGWWQCAQSGAEQFRKDPSKPSCNWYTFTQ